MFYFQATVISRKMTKGDTADVEEAQPNSEFTSPKHESRKKPIVHPSAQAPLPKDYGVCLDMFHPYICNERKSVHSVNSLLKE